MEMACPHAMEGLRGQRLPTHGPASAGPSPKRRTPISPVQVGTSPITPPLSHWSLQSGVDLYELKDVVARYYTHEFDTLHNGKAALAGSKQAEHRLCGGFVRGDF